MSCVSYFAKDKGGIITAAERMRSEIKACYCRGSENSFEFRDGSES